MPRGDGRKPGERRNREGYKQGFTPRVPMKLNNRLWAWGEIKDKQGYNRPGSQNPRKR